MRVLHVPTVPWQPTEGIARSCREIVGALDGVDSWVVLDRDPGAAFASASRVEVISGWVPKTPLTLAFRRVVARANPDIVHLHGGTLAPLLAMAPWLRDVPVVATCYRGAQHAGGRLRNDQHSNLTTGRVLATGGGGVAVARHLLRSGRVSVICTPDAAIERSFRGAGPVVRVRGAANVSARQASWSDAPVVVFAGRAQAARGIDELVAAFPRVRQSIPSACLQLALLPGPEADRLVAQLAGLRWAKVSVGARVDLDALYADAQLGVFPFRSSLTLTPSLAAAEAMAVGLPVVASDVECLAALVEPGVNGTLVAPGRPDALATAIIDLLRDPETWQPRAEGARKTIEGRWSWIGAAEATCHAYDIAWRRHRAEGK